MTQKILLIESSRNSLVSPEIFFITRKQKFQFVKMIGKLYLLNLKKMNINQEKTLSLKKTIAEYNSWCKQFNISSMWGKSGVKRQSSPDEFNVDKFKKMIESKTWNLA